MALHICIAIAIKPSKLMIIFKDTADDTKCLCQVFYHRQGINIWRVTLAFCTRKYLNVSYLILCIDYTNTSTKEKSALMYMCITTSQLLYVHEHHSIPTKINDRYMSAIILQ